MTLKYFEIAKDTKDYQARMGNLYEFAKKNDAPLFILEALLKGSIIASNNKVVKLQLYLAYERNDWYLRSVKYIRYKASEFNIKWILNK